jgi:AcrR family transcriptional regulator
MDRAKKDCILRSATRAFNRFGFKKASVDEIAREAGVAKGTVYLACDSKEDLFYQALLTETRSWSADIARLIDPRTPADDLLGTVALAALDSLERRPMVRDLLLGRHHGLLPNWGDRLDELRALGRQNAVEIVKLGIRQGRFRADLDVDQVAELLQDLQLSTYIFHNRGDDKVERLARRLRAGLDLVLNGMRHRPTVAKA